MQSEPPPIRSAQQIRALAVVPKADSYRPDVEARKSEGA